MTTEIRGFRNSTPICLRCGKWMGRLPLWDEALDKGDCCERCAGTSFRWHECRLIGPRSRLWEAALRQYEAYKDTFREDDFMLAEIEKAVIR